MLHVTVSHSDCQTQLPMTALIRELSPRPYAGASAASDAGASAAAAVTAAAPDL